MGKQNPRNVDRGLRGYLPGIRYRALMEGEGISNYNSLELSGSHYLLFDKGNYRSEGELAQLSSAIKFNRALKVLDLSHNNLGREGAKHIAELLETNEGLDDLDITRTGVMPGIAAICATMRRNSTLQTLRM